MQPHTKPEQNPPANDPLSEALAKYGPPDAARLRRWLQRLMGQSSITETQTQHGPVPAATR
jgi:hypothetical protein